MVTERLYFTRTGQQKNCLTSFSFQDSSRMENYKNDANHISFAFLNIMSEKELSVIINTEFNGNSRLVLLQMGTLSNC